MNILLLNAGSSSLKAALMESADGEVVAHGLADWAGSMTHYQFAGRDGKERSEEVPWKGHSRAVERFVADMTTAQRLALAAVGHRVVHGGRFTSSVRITPEIRSRITALVELAPLHNPPSLQSLAAAEAQLPDVPQVAVFDTAFHATLPPEAHTYPVPKHWTWDWGIRRYGFHGLSHAYCARRAADLLGKRPEELRLVVCHLGHGCSASAVRGSKCVDTTSPAGTRDLHAPGSAGDRVTCRQLEASMAWCSRPAWANTPAKSERPSVPAWIAWDWSWTPRPTPSAGRTRTLPAPRHVAASSSSPRGRTSRCFKKSCRCLARNEDQVMSAEKVE
jgi:hypothetical protein